MSRGRAEDILTRNAEFGNLIMRRREESSDNYNYAISVKTDQDKTCVFLLNLIIVC